MMGLIDDINRIQRVKIELKQILINHNIQIDDNDNINSFYIKYKTLFDNLNRNEDIQYGYLNAQGLFQQMDLSQQNIVDITPPRQIDEPVLYDIELQNYVVNGVEPLFISNCKIAPQLNGIYKFSEQKSQTSTQEQFGYRDYVWESVTLPGCVIKSVDDKWIITRDINSNDNNAN